MSDLTWRRFLAYAPTTALLAFGAAVAVTKAADAATHAPCTARIANPPKVTLVGGGNTTLTGSGQIGGCPAPTGTESVTLTVALQHMEGGVWVDRAAFTGSKSWNRYYRYARQLGLSVDAACLTGQWRTDVRGGDGFAPAEWASPVASFTLGDSGVCGAYGGGDGKRGNDWGDKVNPRPTVYVFAEGRCQRIDVKVFWDGVPSRARSGVRVITDGRVDLSTWQPAGKRFGALSVHRDWRGVTDKGTQHRVVVKVNRGDGWQTRRVVETGGCR